jgi:hypothetical protein
VGSGASADEAGSREIAEIRAASAGTPIADGKGGAPRTTGSEVHADAINETRTDARER